MNIAEVVQLSAIDEERFGFPIARAKDVTVDTLPAILNFCQSQNIKMLIARCVTTDLPVAQRMESHGFQLMDTLVYYQYDFSKKTIPEDIGKVPVRPVQPAEIEAVKQVAKTSFAGYQGHYHADPRLDAKKSDEGYISWAVRSVESRDVADEVLVAMLDEKVVGFATLRLNSPHEGEGVLFGVAPEAQGHGIYRSFMIQGMRWCQAQGATQMVVSTQVTNIAVQKVWCRVGFEPSLSYYTFHKWFD